MVLVRVGFGQKVGVVLDECEDNLGAVCSGLKCMSRERFRKLGVSDFNKFAIYSYDIHFLIFFLLPYLR